MRIKHADLRVVLSILLTVFIVLVLVYIGGDLGFDSEFVTDLISLLPGLFLFIVGAFVLMYQGTGPYAIPGFGILGVGLCLLMGYMNDAGILVPSMLVAGMTLAQVQLGVLVFCILIGAVVAAGGRR